MEILIQDELDKLSPGIFRTGSGLILHPWFNDAKILFNAEGQIWVPDSLQDPVARGYKYAKVKWVAVRGRKDPPADWCIYHSLDANLEPADYLDGLNHLEASPEQIARVGAKLYNNEKIKEFVNCTEEVLDNYRN